VAAYRRHEVMPSLSARPVVLAREGPLNSNSTPLYGGLAPALSPGTLLAGRDGRQDSQESCSSEGKAACRRRTARPTGVWRLQYQVTSAAETIYIWYAVVIKLPWWFHETTEFVRYWTWNKIPSAMPSLWVMAVDVDISYMYSSLRDYKYVKNF
jgi:hypothetical protein